MQPGCGKSLLYLCKNHYLYIAMKIRDKILSVFLSVLVLMTTTLQFHHHDCHGSVFFTVSIDKDIVIGSGNDVSVAECIHFHSPGKHHDPDCKGHGKCSLHIDQSDISRFTTGILPWIESLVYDIYIPLVISESIDSDVAYYVDEPFFLRHLQLIIRSSSIFRAPPVIWL